MAPRYEFVDEWDVRAPIDAVFAALSDATTYPQWWRPVYISVDTDTPSGLGNVSEQRFKGKLPYKLRQTSTITRYEPPTRFEVDVVGDLTGHGTWILDARDAVVRVRFEWTVNADKPLIRLLTPVLRPLFRWNHAYAIERAVAGLEPYAQARAAA
jgi:hypothetical protein